MILVDFSVVLHKAVNAQKGEITENLTRNYVLNMLKLYRRLDKSQELVICCDGQNSWRKEIFPFYKYRRKKSREGSKDQWSRYYDFHDKYFREFSEYLPYRVLLINKIEADDLIGVLSQEFDGPHIVVSNDHDMIQLMNDEVKIFTPGKNEYLKSSLNPKRYLLEQIIRGDSGDDIPNILSEDDVFIDESKKQPTISSNLLEKIISGKEDCIPKEAWERLKHRNTPLISLFHIPENIKETIIEKYNNTPKKDRSNLIKYFSKFNLTSQINNVGDY